MFLLIKHLINVTIIGTYDDSCLILFERRNLSVMESFMEVCKNTRDKLGRDLHKKEKEFLQWMYKRYEEEMQENKHISEYGP